MDALSLAASLIAVVQISSKVVSLCYEYRNTVKDAPRDIARAQSEVSSLRVIVERLLDLIDINGEASSKLLPSLQVTAQPGMALTQCLDELASLSAQLKPKKGWRARRDIIIWPLKSEELESSLNVISHCKGTLQLALAADNTSHMIKILTATQALPSMDKKLIRIEDGIKLMGEGNAQSRRIIEWLDPPNLSSKFQTELQKSVQHSGSWFLLSDDFQSWKDSPDKALWLHGPSGCGKTVLSAKVIEAMQAHCIRVKHSAVVYFYFDYHKTDMLGVEVLIRTFITQLLFQLDSFPIALKRLYEDGAGKFHRQVSPDRSFAGDLEEIFCKMSQSLDHIYIIGDGLDECRDNPELNELLTLLRRLQGLHNAHLMLTSRYVGDIEDGLDSIEVKSIPFPLDQVDSDIHTLIQSVLSTNAKMRKWPAALRANVEEALMQSAQGGFRWAACQLQALQKCSTTASVRQSLQCLPKTLEEIYHRELEGIDESQCHALVSVLRWLTFCSRPMRLIELAEALTIDESLPGQFHYNPDLQIFDPYTILDLSPSLLTIFYESSDGNQAAKTGNPTIVLAHFSVKEFLMSNFIRDGSCSQFFMEIKVANAILAQECLAYLLHIDVPLDEANMESFPFASYAACYWISHTQATNATASSQALEDQMKVLFLSQGCHFENWTKLYNIDMPWRGHAFSATQQSITPLYCAIRLGNHAICQALLEAGKSPNEKCGLLGDPLQAAAYGGDIRLVMLLLDAGADVNSYCGTYDSALNAATTKGYEEVVKVLLSNGSNANKYSFSRRGNSLMIAARNGYISICKLLLDHGAEDYHLMKAMPSSALHAATMGGHKDIARLLLANRNAKGSDEAHNSIIRPASSSLRASQHASAVLGDIDLFRELTSQEITDEECLRYAARAGDEARVLELLSKGVPIDAEAEISDHHRALQSAIQGRHVTLVKRLLAEGADPNIESTWSTALVEAASTGDCEITRMLLEAGAKVNIEYYNPMAAAASSGNLAVLSLLLDYGGDINSGKGSPIYSAARNGQLVCFQELVRRGANLDIGEANGNGAHWLLSGAAEGGSARIAEIILEESSLSKDELLRHPEPMSTAIRWRHSEVVKVLLDHGFDIDTPLENGSPLAEALRLGEGFIAAQLLARNPNVNLQVVQNDGKRSASPLLSAVYSGNLDMVRILIQRGADVSLQGSIQGYEVASTPLGLAAEKKNLKIMRLLLEAGAEVNAQDDKGLSALHEAAKNGQLSLMRLLLEAGADVNIQTNEGFTALHMIARDGPVNALHLLLSEYKADLTLQLINGSQPIHSAACQKNPKIIEALLDAGADINSSNKNGWTPLHFAADEGFWPAVEFLLDRGSDISLRATETGVTALDLAQVFRRESNDGMFHQRLAALEKMDWSNEAVDTLLIRLGQTSTHS